MGVLRKKEQQKKTLEADLNKLRPVVNDDELEKITRTAKTAKGKRVLAALQPLVHEETKKLLCLKGHKCSEKGAQLLKDLYMMRKPFSGSLGHRLNPRLIEPIDHPESLEFLGTKNGSSLLAMCSSTKKRPCRLYLGRLFDEKLYDLYEFDVVHYEGHKIVLDNSVEGAKPLVVFQGAHWDISTDMTEAKNLIGDILGGIKAESVSLEGFSRASVVTAYEKDGQVLIDLDHFALQLKKNPDSSLPKVHTTAVGPRLTLKLCRTKLPEKSLKEMAFRLPPADFVKGSKKTTTDELLETRQRVHVTPQDYRDLNLRHSGL